MFIQDHRPGHTYAPLDQVELRGADSGMVVVRDGAGRAYFRAPAAPEVRFTVGGALGQHTVALEGADAPALTFRVGARTQIDDAGGAFADLLQMLFFSMVTQGGGDWSETSFVRYNGRIYSFFVRWLRDHVHVLKGMKYFSPALKDGIDLYRETQRDDGMIWDNVYPRSGPNYWDVRFAEGGFISPQDADGIEFKRIPVEADVEYLFVEGLYYTWKATGDDGWMTAALDAALRALDYSAASPYRWSQQYGLIKRGYTIDTWDFQNEADSVVAGDPMRIDPERTHFGVMFGDNTGYIAACRYLAEMLEHAGRGDEAVRFHERAAEMRRRLNALCWNGRHFTHHVREQPAPWRDLGVDEAAQVSLSNAYSLNRGLSQEQCAAIIGAYQDLRERLPAGSPGEWYTIYPPFGRGYGGHNGLWQYMNGGVTPIVAGELAHGAFEHGAEAYGVDILRRLADLGQRHGRRFFATYTGAETPRPPTRFTPIELAPYANIDTRGEGAPGVPGWTGEGDNDLHELPSGPLECEGVPFALIDPAANGRRACIGLRRAEGYAESVSIPVGGRAASVYLLHCVSQTQPGGLGGAVTLRYADGERHTAYIVRGANVSGWWFSEAPVGAHGERPFAVAWRGANAHTPDVGLTAWAMPNPRPDAEIERIDLTAADDGAFWAVCGVMLSDQPAFFPPSPISYGIPDNWAAAAVVYALVEGLAGVVDAGTAYSAVTLAPRWLAAGVDAARATVHYPASDGYVAYDYRHDAAARRIEIDLTGSGGRCACHILLPEVVAGDVLVEVGGRAVEHQISAVERSRYVDFGVILPGPQRVTISY